MGFVKGFMRRDRWPDDILGVRMIFVEDWGGQDGCGIQIYPHNVVECCPKKLHKHIFS